MSKERAPRPRFRLPASPRRVESEVDEELRFHLDRRAEELQRAGLSARAARDEAERRFGDVAWARRELAEIDRRRLRGARRAEWWGGALQDLRYTVRGLRNRPGFTVAVVLTLGFGLGATAAMFGIIDRLLLRPPAHVIRPDDVGRVYYTETFSWLGRSVTQVSASYPDFVSLRDHARSLSDVAAYFPKSASLGRGERAQPIRLVAASGGYFRLLGVHPALGRFFGPEGDLPSADPGAVLGDGFWHRAFGADPAVIGQTIEIDGGTYTVIGVAPPRFTGVDLAPVDLWVPVVTVGRELVGDGWEDRHGWRWIRLIARLAPGYTRAQADAEATALFRAALNARAQPDSTALVTIGSVIAAREPRGGSDGASEARISLWLGGVTLLVLVIACANAANLLLARAVGRRKEIGVRLALGVSRGRLVRQLLVESLVLATLGGVVGLALARWGGGLIRSLLLPGVGWSEHLFDHRLLLAAGVLVAGVAIATGVAPAAYTLSQNVVDNLKAGLRGGYRRSRLRTTLVLVQAALSVVLLIGAGLFVRSLGNVRHIEIGFDAGRVLLADLNLTDIGAEMNRRAGRPGTADALYREARDRVAALPVVERASIATAAPFWSSSSTDLYVPGRDSIPTTSDGGPYFNAVTADFFATLGTRILRGRGFLTTDDTTSGRVVVVGETMARMIWPGDDPIGKCLIVGSDDAPCSTVVGVAQDARRQSLTGTAPVMQFYVPLDQRQVNTGLRVLFVRTRGDPESALATVRRAIQSVSPDLPYPTVQYVATQIEREVRPWKLGATLFALFGAMALALAALGLYSVVAYSVAQRRHEMGVRVALGARGVDIARLVLLETLRVIGMGLGAGLATAVVLGRWIEPLLFHVSPLDRGVFGAVIATLLLVGTAASLVPARRAARVEPAEVLKVE